MGQPVVQRAAVLIGVDRTGGLPPLDDAARGARRMERWARAQGVQQITVFTDEAGGRVRIDAIKDEIRRLADLGTIEHLVIYFAGHGININYGERWLLTDAPVDPQAAVDVDGSYTRALHGAFPYVAMISDACRTAAHGTQAQAVDGASIFPSELPNGAERYVDRFYACRLGEAAHEVRDPLAAQTRYRAIYTDTMLRALNGLEPMSPPDPHFVRPWPLRRYVEAEMERRALAGEPGAGQLPDAHLSSDPETSWVARLAPGADGSDVAPTAELTVAEPPEPEAGRVRDTLADRANANFRRVLREASAGVGTLADRQGHRRVPPPNSRRGSGFVVRGAEVVDVLSPWASADVYRGQHVEVDPAAGVHNLLLVLDTGDGVVVPALPAMQGMLELHDGTLTQVRYDPVYGTRAGGTIPALRDLATAAATGGALELSRSDAKRLLRYMDETGDVDPALVAYAVYSYRGPGVTELARRLASRTASRLGAPLFDAALVGRRLDGARLSWDDGMLGMGPLLAPGWTLLAALDVHLPDPLQGVHHHVRPSLWTIFDEQGVGMLRRAIEDGPRP